MKRIVGISMLVILMACNNYERRGAPEASNPTNISEQVEMMLDNDQYVEALALLDEQNETPGIFTLKEKAHLNYGLYLVYRDSDITNMREKMNGGLRQFIETLKLNPDNEKAITEIEQILGIYATFPDRSPDEDVAAALEELGFTL